MRTKYLLNVFIIGIAVIATISLLWRYRFEPQQEKIYSVAIITRNDVATYEQAIEHYQKKMQQLGYEEGKNIFYNIRRFANSKDLDQIISKVIATNPDLITTYSTPATTEAYKKTKQLAHPIPIVFGSMGDPIATGVVKDIQQPGTNVTGITSLSTELTANRIRLLKEIDPSIKRIAMPHSAYALNDAAARKSVAIAQQTAHELDIDLLLLPVSSSAENNIIANSITNANVDGMIVGGDSLIWSGIDLYIAQAIKEKIPLAAFDITQITNGALIGIGPDYIQLGKQAATLTHKILRGGSPATIAIQVPEKLILAVNIATAKAIGLRLSDQLLKRADVIIGK